ncbi:MAG: Two component transcriptional regulator, winged helix family [Microgenomates bacterium 39_7]|nr:MAG: Two component transcriptional regulator, winged helix family [Microgenomates bacterium 39_7]
MKILVVEDEKRVAQYIKKGLELRSHSVDVTNDGEEGLDLACSEPYELIILDRMLPKLSGVKICQQLRQAKKHIPIIMLTAKTEVADRVEGLNAGADDYLGKPFSFIELLARINALARRPVKIMDEVLTEGTLSLNTISFEVKRGKKPINLSKREFALLEFLMRHPGQILSKEQLTQQVWSYESDVLPNTAQVYLGYLRTKIDQAFPDEEPLIHTVRGFGYKFGKD